MIKIRLHSWDLKTLEKNHPEDYATMRALPGGFPPTENGYDDWTAYVQDPGMLPQCVLDLAKWDAIKPLKVLFDRDASPAKGIKEALAAYQVHLPGNELLAVQAVQVREDYCTEDLQHELDKGWRIIAVCPRSGQRRPDYVLGRFTRI